MGDHADAEVKIAAESAIKHIHQAQAAKESEDVKKETSEVANALDTNTKDVGALIEGAKSDEDLKRRLQLQKASGLHASFETPATKVGDLKDANFPMDLEGRVYHLGVKRGEVANRILSVGDAGRASLLSTFLDNTKTSFHRSSTRGFVIHTGLRNGVPVSIIATGMGLAMVDFVIRECRAIVDGPMAVVRFGTCGTPQTNIPIGSLVVASHGSICSRRRYDAFSDDFSKAGDQQSGQGKGKELDGGDKTRALDYYEVSKVVPADPELSQLVLNNLKAAEVCDVYEGLNLTGDSFYSSQGRVTNAFVDHNETLIDEILEIHPKVAAIEMETFHLFHMAQCSRGTVRGAAATIVLAQRKSGEFLDHARTRVLERAGGTAVLDALASFPLPESEVMKGQDCVWEKHNEA